MLPCNMKWPEKEAVSTARRNEIRCSVVVSGSFSEIIKKGFYHFNANLLLGIYQQLEKNVSSTSPVQIQLLDSEYPDEIGKNLAREGYAWSCLCVFHLFAVDSYIAFISHLSLAVLLIGKNLATFI